MIRGQFFGRHVELSGEEEEPKFGIKGAFLCQEKSTRAHTRLPFGRTSIVQRDDPKRGRGLEGSRMVETWEEMLKEVSELKQRVSGKEMFRRGIPFRASVMADELPANFRSLTYEYDRTTRPMATPV
ncbi:hypothetical protein DH2020_039320 [Rehmannia glutinosa]|uniref:Uncharacterized protein n=1 Tax=Rehmannia glutinosa TaxID=99300 RepID=A0ABR0UW62_REHGL